MAGPLDMSLDDLIKKSNSSAVASSRGRGMTSGGAARRIPDSRLGHRPSPYPILPQAVAAAAAGLYGVYSDHAVAAMAQAAVDLAASGPAASSSNKSGRLETGSRLYISNLDYGVSNEDIEELFMIVGELKRYSINYDKSGRSKGTAEVVFVKREDALAAVERYNGVQLDGKAMKVELIGTEFERNAAPVHPLPFHGLPPALPFDMAPGMFLRHSNSAPVADFVRGGGRGRLGFRGGRGRGRGGPRSTHHGQQVSAADLDADLDKYRSEAAKKSE